MSLGLLAKSLLHSGFSLIICNKTVNKPACRMPSANPRQLCEH